MGFGRKIKIVIKFYLLFLFRIEDFGKSETEGKQFFFEAKGKTWGQDNH